MQGEDTITPIPELTWRIGLPVSRLGVASAIDRWCASNPAGILGRQCVAQKPGVIMTLYHIKRVVWQVLAGGVPGQGTTIGILAAPDPAYAQTLALSKRVEGQALVLAHHLAIGRLDRAGIRGQIAVEKLPKGPFTDKADSG